MRLVNGMRREAAEAVVAARRAGGEYESLPDLQRRAGVDRGTIERLAEAGALQGLVADRRRALWSVRGLAPSADDLVQPVEPTDADADLPAATALEEVLADYQSVGFSLRAHPLALIRSSLAGRGVVSATELLGLPDGRRVVVAGMVVVRQRPGTASGVVFLSLEDETGLANVIVWPAVFERHRRETARAPLLLVSGTLQRVGLVANVVASRLEPLELDDPSPRPAAGPLRPLRAPSRDFH